MKTASHSESTPLLITFILTILLLMVTIGCQNEGRGFALPDGNIEDGRTTFLRLNCNACHSVADIERDGLPNEPDYHLGGPVSRVKSYGELVTSIINPSHKISKGYKYNFADSTGHSKMMIYNQFMTVQELVDIVTFLEEQYKVIKPDNEYYRYYY